MLDYKGFPAETGCVPYKHGWELDLIESRKVFEDRKTKDQGFVVGMRKFHTASCEGDVHCAQDGATSVRCFF